ncbi:hypothetical protein GP486_000369 [Trichoglossum hirsutum]|uniref:Uncharacterized protein n=1 Tax=Trichoglossum hirsutum TaxID=265104 RepID=A0A9P8RU09_9PEZI|nr:hypothetical protein GP486_000369 [Trichoglossum hirsutum]
MASSSRATMTNPPSLNFYPKNPSLDGVEFTARCPPDVSPRTRVVAVCGVTNIQYLASSTGEGFASPTIDGWFLSDFYMFNHLLRKAPVANQIWLTCCSPKLLVEQYGRYAHGNPFRDRRVVLEERLLDPILEAETLRVVEPKILLERFIKTVEGECKEAEKAGQDVLLLVFGHGDNETYGITIGSASNTEFREMTAPRLQISRLRVAVGKRVKCALLLTSCYSGGWAMNPDLNLTVIAAAGHGAKSQSWNASLARGFSGSIVASAILDAILASEVEDEESLGKSEMTYQELRTTETYAEMSCLIHDHLKQNDRFHDHHEISFAAQDDKWTEAWRERTGIPMAFFKERWEELSVLPAQADGFSNRDPSSIFTGSFALGGLSETRSGSAMRLTPTKTMPQIYTMVRALAAGYAKSFPGMDNISINTALHTSVRSLLAGEGNFEGRVDGMLALGYILSYRLEGMTMATNYKDFLSLDYPDCTSCCVEAWIFPLYESKEKEAKEKLAKYREAKSMIKAAKIFSTAADGQGYDYDKPEEYLAIAFVESGKSKNEVEQAIAVLKGRKSPYIWR